MTSRILVGHVLDQLAALPDASAHACITSPPYYGLRSYGTEPQVWGGDPACEHGWQHAGERASSPQRDNGPGGDVWNGVTRGEEPAARRTAFVASRGDTCTRCNAWRGELGQEPTLALFLDHLVQVFRAVRRVLRDDGVCFVNMGDSYANSGVSGPQGSSGQRASRTFTAAGVGGRVPDGLKPKDLMMVPARLALALQADGWYLRSDIIWHKPNPMPESVTDRPTSAHEHIFLLTKSARYYYDAAAVKEPTIHAGRLVKASGANAKNNGTGNATAVGFTKHDTTVAAGRNLRNVWTIATKPFSEAHFATFPPELARRCIKAGTSERGCCPACGAPWVRVVKKSGGRTGEGWHNHENDLARGQRGGDEGNVAAAAWTRGDYKVETLGWQPGCTCEPERPPIPCTVLDPFGGSGTVGLVADQLGRDSILIELNPTYAEMARKRIAGDAPMFADVDVLPVGVPA